MFNLDDEGEGRREGSGGVGGPLPSLKERMVPGGSVMRDSSSNKPIIASASANNVLSMKEKPPRKERDRERDRERERERDREKDRRERSSSRHRDR